MFSKLRYLDLSQNYFSDVIPSNIYEMGTLQHLFLDGNMLTGIIPWGIGQLKSLISLDLSSNFMVGPLPDMISMAKLKTCSVSSDICIVRNEDVPSICSKNLQLCSAVGNNFIIYNYSFIKWEWMVSRGFHEYCNFWFSWNTT